MDGSPRSLQADKAPPGSKERKRGLSPSPLGARLGANFVNYQLPQTLTNPMVIGFGYDMPVGNGLLGLDLACGNGHILQDGPYVGRRPCVGSLIGRIAVGPGLARREGQSGGPRWLEIVFLTSVI